MRRRIRSGDTGCQPLGESESSLLTRSLHPPFLSFTRRAKTKTQLLREKIQDLESKIKALENQSGSQAGSADSSESSPYLDNGGFDDQDDDEVTSPDSDSRLSSVPVGESFLGGDERRHKRAASSLEGVSCVRLADPWLCHIVFF